MGLILRMVAAIAITLYCLYKWGEYWFHEGMSNGYMHAIRALCDEHIKVVGRKLVFDGKCGMFFDANENKYLTEIDMDEIVFKED